MRRLISVALSAALALAALSGCGGNGGDQGTIPDQADLTVVPDEGATVATTGATVGGAATPAPLIGEIVWAAAIDPETNAAVTVVDRFPADAPNLFAVVSVAGLPAGAILAARWTYNDVPLDELDTSVEIALPVEGPAWVEFHLARAEEPWPAGTYGISIDLNGEPARAASVDVAAAG